MSQEQALRQRYSLEEYEAIKREMLESDRLAKQWKLLSKERRDHYRARKDELSNLLAIIEQRGLVDPRPSGPATVHPPQPG